MPKIDISERDLTQATGAVGTDIPFIPGLVAETQYAFRKALATDAPSDIVYREASQKEIEEDRFATEKTVVDGMIQVPAGQGTHVKYAVTEYNTPKLCNSVNQFESLFGKNPAVFLEAQEVSGFKIEAGDIDKSYVMAKELLANGMPVYYYGIDPTDCCVTPVTTTAITSGGEDKSGNITTGAHWGHIDITFDKTLAKGTVLKVFIGDVELDGTSTDIVDNILTKDTNKISIKPNSAQTGEINVKAGVALSEIFNKINTYLGEEDLTDKGEYSFKYLTTGGYPNYQVMVDGEDLGLASKMQNIAMRRGDCVAIIESIPDRNASVSPSESSFYKSLCEDDTFNAGGEFSTAFFPWANYNLIKSYRSTNNRSVNNTSMPAAFGYLLDLALNIKTSPNWLAMAGTTRGLVPNITGLDIKKRLSNVIANAYQPTRSADGKRALNAITDIKPYGLTIWGNRTLKTIEAEGLTATNFLNTRNMISDIKKVAYRAAKAQMFEQNSETLWLNFKSEVSPFLEQLKKGNGISDYKLLKLNTKYDGASLGKEEFACAIKIYPLYAVESFEITVVVSDNDVSVG